MNSTIDIVQAVKTYIETSDTKYAIMIDGEGMWQDLFLEKYSSYCGWV